MRLPPEDIRRMLERNASVLISPRAIPRRGTFNVHDEFIVRRNGQHRKAGRWDLQLDPNVLAIEITATQDWTLRDLPYQVIRSAGWRTQRDFYDAWYAKHGYIDPNKWVYCAWFRPIEQPRYLHRKIHLGYTSNPGQSVRGEGQALSEAEHERLHAESLSTDDLRRRYEAHVARINRKRSA